MAVKTLYLKNALASGSNHLSLQDGGSAPATATTGTGWTVNKTGSGNYSRMDSQTERSTFSTTAQPNGAPDNTLGDCFRTENTLAGDFASGNWTLTFPVIAVTSGGDQDGRVRVRLWKSANADGSGATEITAGTQVGGTVTNLTTSTAQNSAITFNPGAINLADQYLFVQVAWEITGAGGSNGRDVLLRVGSAAKVDTTDFTPAPVSLAGSSAGGSTASGALTVSQALAGSSAGVASTSGALTVTQSLAGGSTGGSTAVGNLTVESDGPVALAGSSAGVASTSGALTVTQPAGGGGWRPSAIYPPERKYVYLRGSSAGAAKCQGNLTVGSAVALRGRSRGVARCRGRIQSAVIQDPPDEELLMILLVAADVI